MSNRSSIVLMVAGVVTALAVGEGFALLADSHSPEPSAWPTFETEMKRDQLAALGASPDVTLLGTSVTEAAVDPAMLAELIDVDSVYNAALPFSSPLAYEAWFNEVITGFDPSLVVIGVAIWPIHGDNPSGLGMGIEQAARPRPLVDALEWSSLFSKRGVLADWDMLKDREDLRDSGWWTDLGHQTGYYDRVGESLEGRFGAFGEPRLSDAQRDGLERTIRSARAGGTEVVLVLEPARFPGPVTEEEIASYIDWLETMADRWNVEFWDTYSVDWDDSLFSDEVHFNRAGTEAYTRYLAALLRSDPK